MFFFFKQKTAYEMRISDWSSDVCSSDLARALHRAVVQRLAVVGEHRARVPGLVGLGEVPGRAAAVGADLAEVEVGGPWLRAVGLARAEHQRLTVRPPCVLASVAERLGRHVGGHVGADARGITDARGLRPPADAQETAVHATDTTRIPMPAKHPV